MSSVPIRISEETRQALFDLKGLNVTYDDVIVKLLADREEHQGCPKATTRREI
jgi:hypothetical protein